MAVGTVYLVGAGPGDPKLLTVGGKEALAIADTVVYDRLVHPSLLNHAPASAMKIYVGKQADRHTLTQDKINDVLSEHALSGKTVVRLKGGDPFVFGRGGEEAEHLRELSVPYVVIPGVTSAIAAPAYAGIPITHRDASSSFAVITGHERAPSRESGERLPGGAEQRRQWNQIAHAADTLVFLMGVESLSEITEKLIQNGRLATTPVALVRWGTWAGRQETLVGELGEIAETAKRIGFKAPAVTVVGDVVTLRDRLQWWDNRPLSGKKIVVTRAREQSSGLVERLITEGSEPIEFPTIRIVEPSDSYHSLDIAIKELSQFNWVVFTSTNAVTAFFDRLNVAGKDVRTLAGIQIASVGPATTLTLKSFGIIPDFQPNNYSAEEVANQFPGDASSASILFPCVAGAGEKLVETLKNRGADVSTVAAYENVVETNIAEALLERLRDHDIDVITFTSSSTVRNFVASLGEPLSSFPDVKIACIGPSTAATVQDLLHRNPDILATEFTVPGLVDALRLYYSINSGG